MRLLIKVGGYTLMVGNNLKILDHYYLRLANNCFFVVVGNRHLGYGFIGYIKYCPLQEGSSIWASRGIPLERLVKWYDAREIHEYTPWKTYIPYYDAELPYVPMWLVTEFYNPVDRLLEIIRSPRDGLEQEVIEVSTCLGSLIGGLDDVGVTGSLLPGIHNPLFSDIDLVVYGWRKGLDVVEAISENRDVFKPFTGSRLLEWSKRISERTGLTRRQVELLYRNWRRGVFNGREYSVTYSGNIHGSLSVLQGFRTIGVTEITAELSGGVDALDYPSKSRIERYRVIGGSNTPFDIVYVESFESLYTPLLYEGGKAFIRGLLQCSQGLCKILVGGVEEKGFIAPGDTA
ncbi:hypothetical protein [Desulfurococcus mucosus]|nr:hypothetical protein [Desulfurococcus mucosus]